MTASGEYYDSIAPGYVRLHGEEQRRKLREIAKRIEVKKTDRVLNVGCGPCFAIEVWPVPSACAEMVGVDPSKELVAQARKRGVEKAVVCKAEEMPSHAEEIGSGFDVVLSLTAVQNFDDVDAGLQNIEAFGKDRFVISYLKRAAKSKQIDAAIERLFVVTERVEQDFDIIYFATKK